MKIEITVNGKTIEVEFNDKDLKELIEDDEEVSDILWRSKGEGKYFSISHGKVYKNIEGGYTLDGMAWSAGNYYQTEEEAQKELERRKAITRIKRYAAEKWSEFVPDWNDYGQIKYHICYDHDQESFYGDLNYCLQQLSFMYFEKREHKDEIIEKFELDLKLIFNIK